MITTTTEYENLSREELILTIVKIKHELDQLKRLVFGSRHERFVPSLPPEQLTLGLDTQVVESPAPALQKIEYTRKKKEASTEKIHTGRMKLPADLPREKVIIEPTEDVSGLKKIGEEITEELERIPGKLYVRQYIRPKYAKAHGEGVVIG